MHDLFAKDAEIALPELVEAQCRIEGNLIRRLRFPAQRLHVKWSDLPSGKGICCSANDFISFAIVDKASKSLHGQEAVLRVDNACDISTINDGKKRWMLPKPAVIGEDASLPTTSDVVSSWKDSFTLRTQRYDGDVVVQEGLRVPQVGAVHAVLAHWSVSKSPVTVVLPTGVGKTETMLALLVMAGIERLLVIVPSDALRNQVADKFLSLGRLKFSGCLEASALMPTVAVLKRSPKSDGGLMRLLDASQVVVTTMDLITKMPEGMQQIVANWPTHLFVDEAHHIAAKKWKAFKQRSAGKTILQFTATPFRNDQKRVDGRHIYSYPLRQAQKDGLFKKINYVPVTAFSQAAIDDAIIEKVGEQLDADLANGHRHLAMARTQTIDQARVLHEKYAAKLGRFNPQIIHSKMSASQRREALQMLRDENARIIVCVDMLGEGFDLPELKIAALHNKHKSEAITLQFVGRFTRTRSDLGEATVIANLAMDDVSERLKALYAEDADWNDLLNVVGYRRTFEARRREDIIAGLVSPPERFHVENLQPRMSTIVYKTDCIEWSPDNVESAIGANSTIADGPSINLEERLLFFATRDEEQLPWTDVKFPKNVQYNLIMAHWDDEQNLLFINTSRKKDLHLPLAQQLAGPSVQRIKDDAVFRVLHGFDRLMLSNLGLSEAQRRPVRYSMFMGVDIAAELDAYERNRSKTLNNLFGQGYIDEVDLDEDGEEIGSGRVKDTIGCSIKGKVWSHGAVYSPAEWMRWCQDLGRKLLDDSITTRAILRNLVRAIPLESMPDKIPLAIDWPEDFLDQSEEKLEIEFNGRGVPFYECEIALDDFSCEGGIRFRVESDDVETHYLFEIENYRSRFTKVDGPDLSVKQGKKSRPILEIFEESPPHAYMTDGDMIVGSSLFVIPRREDVPPFDLDKIRTGGWEGINIRVESQGLDQKANSIQRRVIDDLVAPGGSWDIVYDDDGSGEVADVVAMKLEENRLQVHLYHCKYSSKSKTGARAHDLHEICGQAQKSIRWAENLGEMLKHFQRREARRLGAGQTSRFQKGDVLTLVGWINRWQQLRAEFSITLVQPGYSRRQAESQHLELLAATESYLMDTYRIPMRAWFSE